MTDSARDAKLIQYLSEAYAKEKELETALEAHIGMTTRKPYKKRLQEHLRETKGHAREVERRIKKIGGGGPQLADSLVGQVTGQVKSLAKGPLHMVRGTGEAEKMLKNAKTEYWNEHEEIATYTAIETLADSLGDRETAQLARAIRREEERMAKFLAGQISTLTKAVVTEEVPASERRKNGARTRRRSSSSSKSRASSTRKRSSSSSSRKRSGSSSTRKRPSSSKSGGASTRKRASSSSTRKRPSSSRSRASSTRKRSTSSSSRPRSSGSSSRSRSSGTRSRSRRRS